MVVDTRFELVTPAMSMQCSTTELIDQPILKVASSLFGDAKSSLNCNPISGRHHAFDFVDKLAQVEWLGQNFCTGWGWRAAAS